MEAVNKSGKRRRGRRKHRKLSHGSSADGHMFPAVASGSPEKLDVSVNRQGLSALHTACLYGHMASVRFLLESKQGRINDADLQGRRPVHMVLSSQSSPNTTPCLTYLLEQGADVNATTDSGATPLHLAASEGLLDCTEILTQAGADVSAQDGTGHTPLDLARIWCHRKVARHLKSRMWQMEKKKEMQQRKQAQTLYSDLLDMVRVDNLNKKTLIGEKVAEWANKKGFPPLKDVSSRASVSRYHTQCLPAAQNSPKAEQPMKQKPQGVSASTYRPWTIFMGVAPQNPLREPDLRDSVVLWRDGGGGRRTQISTKWDSQRRPTPDVPPDVLERVLFPRAFPSRINSPRSFLTRDIMEVQHRGHPQGRSTSPWTEVAMHLAEVLEHGHY